MKENDVISLDFLLPAGKEYSIAEFKRLALADPYCQEENFLAKEQSCAECAEFLASVKAMDMGISKSVDVAVPADLLARLKLRQEIEQENISRSSTQRYFAMAASFMVAVLVAGLMYVNFVPNNEQIAQDYVTLIEGVAEHLEEVDVTPVWDSGVANQRVRVNLASYDPSVNFKDLSGLRFGRICPMGIYRGLHANIEVNGDLVTFAYIKGEPVEVLKDMAYQNHFARVKPLKGGNLVIISQHSDSLNKADSMISDSLKWQI
jgi:hypothetical protein